MNLIHAHDVIKYVKASAGRAKLSVQFEDINAPRHDGDTIYLPKIDLFTTKQQLEEMMGSVDHEVGHDLYSNFKLLQEKKFDPTKDFVGYIWNWLEDSRINSLEADEYLGFRSLWDSGMSVAATDIVSRSNDKVDDKYGQAIASIAYWESQCNSHRFPLLSSVFSSLKYDEKQVKILSSFTSRLEDVRNIVEKEEGSIATLTLSYDILKALSFEADEIERPEEERAGSKEGGSGSDPKGNKGTDEKGKGSEGEQEGEGKGFEGGFEGGPEPLGGEHDEPKYNRTESKGAPHHKGSGGWDVAPEIEVFNFNKHVYPRSFDTKNIDTRHADMMSRLLTNKCASSAVEDGFSNQVRRLLQIIARVRYERGVKKGKLDQSRIARICLKEAKGFNERLFKRKINSDTLDAAITLLVDTSGSMSGTKYLHAVTAAKLMNKAIGEALHIPTEILGFTDSPHKGNLPIMIIHKSFDDKVGEEALLDSFAKASTIMCGNPDGENIMWAYDRLAKRKEKKKLLIVFSDGSPSASRYAGGGLHAFTKKVIKEIEKEKVVDIYGVGIQDSSVNNLYSHHCVIEDSAEISHKLLEIIESKLLTTERQ